jgi:hypothetical protein
MKSNRVVAALAAGAALAWGSAHAAPEAAEPAPEAPGIIIFQLEPAQPGTAPQAGEAGQAASEHEQVMLGMLLLQMLGAMQSEGESAEVRLPPGGQRI